MDNENRVSRVESRARYFVSGRRGRERLILRSNREKEEEMGERSAATINARPASKHPVVHLSSPLLFFLFFFLLFRKHDLLMEFPRGGRSIYGIRVRAV